MHVRLANEARAAEAREEERRRKREDDERLIEAQLAADAKRSELGKDVEVELVRERAAAEAAKERENHDLKAELLRLEKEAESQRTLAAIKQTFVEFVDLCAMLGANPRYGVAAVGAAVALAAGVYAARPQAHPLLLKV